MTWIAFKFVFGPMLTDQPTKQRKAGGKRGFLQSLAKNNISSDGRWRDWNSIFILDRSILIFEKSRNELVIQGVLHKLLFAETKEGFSINCQSYITMQYLIFCIQGLAKELLKEDAVGPNSHRIETKNIFETLTYKTGEGAPDVTVSVDIDWCADVFHTRGKHFVVLLDAFVLGFLWKNF